MRMGLASTQQHSAAVRRGGRRDSARAACRSGSSAAIGKFLGSDRRRGSNSAQFSRSAPYVGHVGDAIETAGVDLAGYKLRQALRCTRKQRGSIEIGHAHLDKGPREAYPQQSDSDARADDRVAASSVRRSDPAVSEPDCRYDAEWHEIVLAGDPIEFSEEREIRPE